MSTLTRGEETGRGFTQAWKTWRVSAFIFSVAGETGFLLEARKRLGPEWQAVPCDALICGEHNSSEVFVRAGTIVLFSWIPST